MIAFFFTSNVSNMSFLGLNFKMGSDKAMIQLPSPLYVHVPALVKRIHMRKKSVLKDKPTYHLVILLDHLTSTVPN